MQQYILGEDRCMYERKMYVIWNLQRLMRKNQPLVMTDDVIEFYNSATCRWTSDMAPSLGHFIAGTEIDFF